MFFQSLSNGFEMARQSWRVLMLDKELLIFPLLSGAACLLVLASFAIPLWGTGYAEAVLEERQAPEDPVVYVVLFAFYFVNYFVIVFFNSALIACALIRFNGGNPTLGDGLRAANSRLPQIAAWALVSATVGLILRLIESRSERAARFVAGLLGMAWSAVTYFVVPVLVVERLGPIDAVKRSFGILRHTWGEALAANFGIGFFTFLASLVAILPAVGGIYLGGAAAVVGVVITGLLWMLVALVSAALNGIVVGALYQYAGRGRVPDHFDEGLLRQAFRQT